jgi:hypothetical protein
MTKRQAFAMVLLAFVILGTRAAGQAEDPGKKLERWFERYRNGKIDFSRNPSKPGGAEREDILHVASVTSRREETAIPSSLDRPPPDRASPCLLENRGWF